MGHPKPIETGESDEYLSFKSSRTAQKTCRVMLADERRPEPGMSAFDAFAHKIATLKAEQIQAD